MCWCNAGALRGCCAVGAQSRGSNSSSGGSNGSSSGGGGNVGGDVTNNVAVQMLVLVQMRVRVGVVNP